MSAPNSSVGRYNSTLVDEGRKCWIPHAIKMKVRTVVRRGGERRLRDPESELLLKGMRVSNARIIFWMKINN